MFREISPGTRSPQISVLMPIYQQQAFVKQAIKSVLAQTGIAVEIIISDDCSTDATFRLAEETVSAWLAEHDCEHRVLLRQGRARLRRDHLPLLADAASCDIVAQAHGDDLSHPMRCRILHSVLNADPRCALAASRFAAFFTGEGGPAWNTFDSPYPASRVPDEIIIGQSSEFLIGCAEAWKRSSMAPFGRLDTGAASVGHDRILPFRAALVGYVAMVQLPLLMRRLHDQAWSQQMIANRGDDTRFGWSAVRLNCLNSMSKDLDSALAKALISAPRHAELARVLKSEMNANFTALSAAFDRQINSGMRLAWLSEDETP